MAKEEIGILGGGISGLTFASLVKNSVVLEKEHEFGGLARSVKSDGYTFDLGSHIIFSKNKNALSFMLDLLSSNVIKHRRNTKILYQGHWVKYPFENGLGNLPRNEAYECAIDYINKYIKREKGDLVQPENFKEWMYYRFGKAISEKYLYPYNRKIWDIPPEKMDIFWVEGRVPQPPLEDILKAALNLESEGYVHQLNFYYPEHGGYESVTTKLAGTLDDGQKINNFKVRIVRKEDNHWIVGNDKQEFSFDKIVNTLHPTDFFDAYKETPKEVKEAVSHLKYNSIYLIMIGLNKPKLNDVHWAYIPDSNILPNRISFPSNFSPNMTPKGHSSVLAEVTFSPNGEKSKMKNEEVIGKTIDDLSGISIFDKKNIVFTKLVKLPYAYVVYDLDYLKNMEVIENFTRQEGITLLGRFGEFRYYNADKCIASALEKAKLFLQYK